jgi:hypothetical protein
MDQEKSQIDSFDVSLGTQGAPGAPGASSLSQPGRSLAGWNILVCSDLGYVSHEPAMVRIAEWNDFMALQNIVLSGTIKDEKPVFVEFPVKSMKDLSMESIMANAAPFAAYSRAVFGLQQLIDGKTGRDDCIALIKKAGLAHDEERRVLACFGTVPAARRQKPPAQPQHSSIDNILSMVDGTSSQGDGTSSAGDGTSSAGDGASASPDSVAEPADAPRSPTDALRSLSEAVTGADETAFDKAAAGVLVREFKSRLQRQGKILTSQPFFASRAASLNCLSALAKIIGRKKEVGMSVVSCPRQDMEENLEKVLSSCMESGNAPDIVVWDYDVNFTNASMESMGNIAKTAEQFKCMVVAPLSMDDPLVSGCSGRGSIVHLFEEVRFLPYKKLRTGPASRCLCFCGPSCAPSGWNKTTGGNCCWFMAIRWAEMLLAENNPLAAKDLRPSPESVFSQDPPFGLSVAPAVAAEAATFGLTLFEPAVAKATLDKAVTVIGRDQAAESYSSFLFNLAVNRVVRLAGIRLLAVQGSSARTEVAAELEGFLRTELQAYGVMTAGGNVTATAGDDSKIAVDVDSDVTVSGYPVRFTFSF